MIITCDTKIDMGYIYLQPPKMNNPIWEEIRSLNPDLKYNTTEIPLISEDKEVQKILNNLTLTERTYLEDLDIKFEEEYLNDKIEGYIIGIEQDLTKEKCMEIIKNQMFRLYKIEYLGKKSTLLTLDYIDSVLDINNFIYPANNKNDKFYILAIEDGTCYLKGVISIREGIFDGEYFQSLTAVI